MRVLVRDHLSPGRSGVNKTLGVLRKLIHDGGKDPRVVQLARQITMRVPERNDQLEISAVTNYVQKALRFVRDPLHAETMVHPGTIAEDVSLNGRSAEDCDGHVVFLGALLNALGYEVRPVVESYRPDHEPSHVALEVLADGMWVHLDPSAKHQPIGHRAGVPTKVFNSKELPMLGAPVAQEPTGGIAEESGQNESSVVSDIFEGILKVGQFVTESPLGQSWLMGEQVEHTKDLLKYQKEGAIEVYQTLYGKPPDASTQPSGYTEDQMKAAVLAAYQRGSSVQPAAKKTEIPTWAWVAGVSVLALGAGYLLTRG